jgi:hypothetical protein
MRAPFLRIAVLTLPLALLCAAQAGSPSPAHFPAITADSLSKQTLHLPGDFGGGESVVLVAFERDQQKDVDTWAAGLTGIAKERNSFHFFEIPVLPWRDVFYRWWLNTAMRSGTPDDAARKRTVPLYLDKAKFKAALDISNEKAISVLLLDRGGDVVWRTSGDWTDEKQRALAYALDHR